MGFIQVSKKHWGFEDSQTGEPFVPIGANHCGVMAAIEDGGYCGCVFHLFGNDEDTAKTGVEEAARAFERMADLGLNVARMWVEPNDFFPVGYRLDPVSAEKFDRLLDAARKSGIRVSLGMHLTPHTSGWKIHNFEPPHDQRLLEHLYLMGQRWGNDDQIFSWTIIGEGTLPWNTPYLRSQWSTWLRYWYNETLDDLRKAWGKDVTVKSFNEAPVPPENIGRKLGLAHVVPGKLDQLPKDEWANSTWRYDWRLFMDEIGSSRVAREVRMLRSCGAKQMITVGNNSWTFPNLPAGQMATGYNPYFYIDYVDYLCLHNYPMPQCLDGASGDPLDSEEAMQSWLSANDAMGRICTSLGKPVILEEWGWYGGGEAPGLGVTMKHRSEEDQLRYCDRIMETSQHTYSGWMNWLWRDMPKAADLSRLSGLYAADGNRVKPWGKRYAEWAAKLKKNPPQLLPAKKTVEMKMKSLYTSDLDHETWWIEVCRDYQKNGPYDFKQVYERKPLTIVDTDMTGKKIKREKPIETPMGVREN